jgi:uncharacterized membrane protein YbhN (UPF0104 family)
LDPADIEDVLAPVVAGEADFVVGSRVLGRSETGDKVRRAGVTFFGGIVRVLTGAKVTDTSSGLRAMRAEVTATVRQEQVQYQTSELLIGAIYAGYRIAERPVVMRERTAGESKKGANFLYGLRYARVILKTWWRERRPGVGIDRYLPWLRAAAFVASVALVGVVAVRALGGLDRDELTLWSLPLAFMATAVWWLLLACGWSVLLGGRIDRRAIGSWCRTQALRYLPGGIWAPASRAVVVNGTMLDKLTTVGAENLIALGAALAVGGVAFAAAGHLVWAPLVLAVAAPLVVSRFVASRTRVSTGRAARATAVYVGAFVAYAVAAVLVQAAVSGFDHPWSVAGAASVAWGVGLVVVIAPGGLGVRELVYVALLSPTIPSAEAAAAAVALRVVTIAAELVALVLAGRPGPVPTSATPAERAGWQAGRGSSNPRTEKGATS